MFSVLLQQNDCLLCIMCHCRHSRCISLRVFCVFYVQSSITASGLIVHCIREQYTGWAEKNQVTLFKTPPGPGPPNLSSASCHLDLTFDLLLSSCGTVGILETCKKLLFCATLQYTSTLVVLSVTVYKFNRQCGRTTSIFIDIISN